MLHVDDLTVDAGTARLIDGVSLHIGAGEHVALLGASGSGKSLTASAIIGHLPPGIHVSGSIAVNGHEVGGLPTPQRPRDARPSMVFQDSATALNPMVTVGLHLQRAARGADTVEVLRRMGFADPARILASYPLELSGGQRQRVCIAMALVCGSRLLVADEPTTALDVISQAQVVAALREVDALLFITHDIAVAASLCDRILVMDGGRIVEDGATRDVIGNPRAAVTARLVTAARADDHRRVVGL